MRLPSVPGHRGRILALDLSAPVADAPQSPLLARIAAARRLQLRDVVEVLGEAAHDPGVRALLVRVDHPAATWAHAEELRGALTEFVGAGKPAIAHAQSFGEVGDGTLAYYVATACSEIHLQPSGDVGLVGLAAEVPFIADLLAKLDLVADFEHRHEYKTASNLLTERAFTDAHRQAADRIVASHHEHLVDAIAAGRRVSAQRAAELVDSGPVLGADAARAGLVDRLAYRDETVADVKRRLGGDCRLLTVDAYRAVLRRRRLWPRRRAHIALIHGYGAIQAGHSRRSALGPAMGSDTVVTNFQQAVRDRRIRAILFRVDSPGGSAVASDAIWRAVVRARQAGKPVVVSMGSVAGSGGYWVSMAADRIVASPGTLTGSIGVVAGKLVTRGLRERLGITSDEAHRGRNALMFSGAEQFTADQRGRLDGFLDRVYDEFVDKVADGRALPRERVAEAARGRVWTGADAVGLGLVDDLGGYREALAATRAALGLDASARLRVRVVRQPLRRRLRGGEIDDAQSLAGVIGDSLRAVGLADGGMARMPGWLPRPR